MKHTTDATRKQIYRETEIKIYKQILKNGQKYLRKIGSQ